MSFPIINTVLKANRIWTPIIEQVRYTNRPNLKKPLPLHYKRKRMLEVCKPRYLKPYVPCLKPNNYVYPYEEETPKENLFAAHLAKRMLKNFEKYPMIAIFHRNSYTQHEMLKFRGILFDAKFDIFIDQWINSAIAKKALGSTKWAPALPLLTSQTVLGYSNSTNIPKLNKLMKKMPNLILLGVITENKLMNKADMEAFSKIPNIDSIRAQLSHTLSMAAINISRTLETSQISLSNSLTAYSTQPTTTTETTEDKSDAAVTDKEKA